VSNATPKLMAQLAERALADDIVGARTLYFTLLPWMRAAFAESNPLAAKAGLAMMGRIENVLRLPLVPLDPTHEPAVRAALQQAGALP
ncbi:MAG: dihydrodipicolinate synthase family protein, partial [Gemmatimonadaceae bacterium]